MILEDDSVETLADWFADCVLVERRTLGMADYKWHRWDGKTWTEEGAIEMARCGVRRLIVSLACEDAQRRLGDRVDFILRYASRRFNSAGLPYRAVGDLDLPPTIEQDLFGDRGVNAERD